VGRIIEVGHDVPREWINRVVFAFNPHESHFLSHVEDLVPLPPDLPAAQATLIPTMETAVTLVMDSRPVIGENVIVLGQGAVGLTTLALLAAFPLKRLIAVDRYPRRLIHSRLMGAQFTFPADDPETAHNIKALLNNEGGPGLADLVVEVSGAAEALDTAINLAGFAGRVVVGSWYGAKRVSLDLASHFHRNRIILSSSQVSTLGPSMQARWTRTRRMSVAVAQLQRVRPAGMITHSFPVEQAPEAYCLLDEHPGEALWIVLTYGESM
jgi:threonine dehydrogenase-like Zn-dependent dehydrogenase